jgi:tetratricopeptide (TPR) repeat protein
MNNAARKPKALEEEAKHLEEEDPIRAQKLYGEAADGWLMEAESAYTRSRFLQCGRKSGCDKAKLLISAREFAARYEKDPWIAQTYAWICHDLAKKAAESGDAVSCLRMIRECLARFGRIADPTLLCERIVAVLRICAEVLETSDAAQRAHGFQLLSGLLKDDFLKVEHRLSKSSDDDHMPSLKMLFYLARRICLQCDEWQLLADYMNRAVTVYPDDPWFHESRIAAADNLSRREEARSFAEQAMEILPEAWAPAFAYADILIAEEKPEEAITIMSQACLFVKQPWPWQRLAAAAIRLGRHEEARQALGVALSYLRAEEFAKGWKLHHQAAKTAVALGRMDEAAEEEHLSMEARNEGGWKIHLDQEEFLREHCGTLATRIAEQKKMDPRQLRRAARERYIDLRDHWMRRTARKALITRVDKDRGFAFARDDEGRDIYIGRDLVVSCVINASVLIAAASTIDRKKGRKGWKAVWISKACPES